MAEPRAEFVLEGGLEVVTRIMVCAMRIEWHPRRAVSVLV